MALTSKQRSYLRSLSHHLNANIIIGKNGLNDSAIFSIKESLIKNELIKIKFLATDKNNLKDEILKKTQSFIVGCIGKIIIIYKPSEKKKNINLPK